PGPCRPACPAASARCAARRSGNRRTCAARRRRGGRRRGRRPRHGRAARRALGRGPHGAGEGQSRRPAYRSGQGVRGPAGCTAEWPVSSQIRPKPVPTIRKVFIPDESALNVARGTDTRGDDPMNTTGMKISRIRRAGAAALAGAAVLTAMLTGCQSSVPGAQQGQPQGSGSAAPTASATATSGANDGIPSSGRATVPVTIQHSTASGGRTLALTFDDGPSPAWTPRILALLARYHAHATFCEIGPQARANPQLVKDVIAAGDRLCDHSVSHNEAMDRLPKDRQVYEVVGAQQMIQQAGGPGTQVDWFRAPGGDFSP